MTIRPILTVPNPILKQVSQPVDSMRAANGIGLAAVQIGEPVNVIVMDLSREEEEAQLKYFVNPEILEDVEDLKPYQEGCLTITASALPNGPKGFTLSAFSTKWTISKVSFLLTISPASNANAR